MGRRASASARHLALLAAISIALVMMTLPTGTAAVGTVEAARESTTGAAGKSSISSLSSTGAPAPTLAIDPSAPTLPLSGRAAARRRDLLQAGTASPASRIVKCTALTGLAACSDPLCFESFELRRNATSGAVECRPLPAASANALNLLLPVYDGDYLFLSTGDNAVASASVVDNTNAGTRFVTREGLLRLRAPFAERVRNTGAVLGGLIGRFSQRRASAEIASSWAVGTNGQRPLQTEASIGALPKLGATSMQGLYGPGFAAVGRGAAAFTDPAQQGGSVEDNVALDVTSPYGLFGRRRQRRSLQQQQEGRRGRQQQRQQQRPWLSSSSPPPVAAEDEEDMAALRAQLGRLVAKGAIKSDAMFELRGGAGPEGDEGGDDEGGDEGGGAQSGRSRQQQRRQRQEQQPALRTGGTGSAAGGGAAASVGGGGPIAPALLPFCRPRLGLFCSDTDLLRVLRKARPDAVLLSEDAPAWGEAFVAAEIDPRVLIRTDPIAGLALPAASGVVNSKLDARLGTFMDNAVIKATLGSTGFGLAPAARAIGAAPALAFTLGQGKAEATLEAREARPRLVIFPGVNFGSLAGLTTVEATQGK